jgi:hypothetical protein
MRTAATISTIGFVAGAAALGAGAIVFFTASPGDDAGHATAAVAVGADRVWLVGRW